MFRIRHQDITSTIILSVLKEVIGTIIASSLAQNNAVM